MSYTPTPQAEVLDRRPAPELEDALAETAERLFVHGQLGRMNIPLPLRLGPKTAAAIRHLLTAHSPWFSLTDKVQYLLESRTLRPYRHYWGLLAGVFPNPRAGVVSDLFVHVQPKLRALLFLSLANRPECHTLLPDYFNRYLTSAWSDPALTILIGSVEATPGAAPVPTLEGLRFCARTILPEGIDDLRRGEQETSPQKIVSSILCGNNKLRAAARWDNTAVSSLLEVTMPDDEDDTNPGRYFTSRVLLRTSHMVNRLSWDEKCLIHLLQRIENPHYGAKYAAYVAMYYQHRLTPDSLQQVLKPFLATEAWSKTAVHHVLNETILKTGEVWSYTNSYRRASNLMRLIVYLRAHPNPRAIAAMPTAKFRIKNILRSFWRQEFLQPPTGRVNSLPLGRLVFNWAGRLERYLQTAAW